jgi:hypothetical protein
MKKVLIAVMALGLAVNVYAGERVEKDKIKFENASHGAEYAVKKNLTAAWNPSEATDVRIVSFTSLSAGANAYTISTEDLTSGTTTRPRMITVCDESGSIVANKTWITVGLESGGSINGTATTSPGSPYAIDATYECATVMLNGTNGFVVDASKE